MPPANPTTAPLLSLIPSYNPTTLPPRLTSLAASLLTQSRQRAPQLKPEEEIARPYACAEIAVDRLRETLRLPPKKTGKARGGGGPPCKPAVYRKLFGFLEGVLEREIVTPKSTNKRKRDVIVVEGATEGEPDEDDTAEVATLSKRAKTSATAATPTKIRTPASKPNLSASKTHSSFTGRIQKHQSTTTHPEAPPHVMPTIRKLTKHYATTPMAPHIYTGVCVVLRLAEIWPPSPSTSSDDLPEDLHASTTALVVALYLLVLTRMQKGQLKMKTFHAVIDHAVEAFRISGKGVKLEGEMIQNWIRRANREGWAKGQDWWDSVPERTLDVGVNGMGGTDGDDIEMLEDDEDDVVMLSDNEADVEAEDIVVGEASKRKLEVDLEQEDPEDVLLPGLGTMMQDALDWNSEERRRAFESWKKGIMKRLEAGGSNASAIPASAGRKKAIPNRRANAVAAH
jgi:origin recognition complex subunit 6